VLVTAAFSVCQAVPQPVLVRQERQQQRQQQQQQEQQQQQQAFGTELEQQDAGQSVTRPNALTSYLVRPPPFCMFEHLPEVFIDNRLTS
jgi:hypothetical protein